MTNFLKKKKKVIRTIPSQLSTMRQKKNTSRRVAQRRGSLGNAILFVLLLALIGVPVARVRMIFIPLSNASFVGRNVFAASPPASTWRDCIARLYAVERDCFLIYRSLRHGDSYFSRRPYANDSSTRECFRFKPTPRDGISLFQHRPSATRPDELLL